MIKAENHCFEYGPQDLFIGISLNFFLLLTEFIDLIIISTVWGLQGALKAENLTILYS